MSAPALEAVEKILAAGGEPDDVLRSVVGVLAEQPTIVWAGIAFIEDGDLVLGPEAGEHDKARRSCFPIAFQGAQVGELWVDGEAEAAVLEEVAHRVAAHVLIGWDTRGERWEP